MTKIFGMTVLVLAWSITLLAQGRGNGPAQSHGERPGFPAMSPGSLHGNAPAGTPAAAADRNLGLQRAEQVGEGKKRGLEKAVTKPPVTVPGSLHSNAPAGTPAAAAERQFGNDRAEDSGQGKKKGLEKPNGNSDQ